MEAIEVRWDLHVKQGLARGISSHKVGGIRTYRYEVWESEPKSDDRDIFTVECVGPFCYQGIPEAGKL